MALREVATVLQGTLGDLRALTSNLQKYESAFSADAKQVFKGTNEAAAKIEEELLDLPDGEGIAAFLATGAKAISLKAALLQLQHSVTAMNSGTIPVPRSSKEELSRIHGVLLGTKMNSLQEHLQLVSTLRKLGTELESQQLDIYLLETNLDNAMRSVLQQVHGTSSLEPEVLSEETARLNDAVAAAQSSGAKQDADVALLALNSLARLHASHADPEEEEEEADSDGPHTDECVVGSAGPGVEEDEGEEEDEDEDDDDDDPFFMPMPGAIKWAEASKFKELARPLAPEQPADKQFMIVMEDESQSPLTVAIPGDTTSSSTVVTPGGAAAEQQGPGQRVSYSGQGAAVAAAAGALAAASLNSPAGAQPDLLPPGPPGEAEALPSPGQAPDAAAAARAVSSDGTAAGDAAQAAAAAGSEAAAPEAGAAGDAAGGPPTVVVPPTPGAPGGTQESPAPTEKLSQFVNFLNGENPGACMFHAQMRLSPEGCMKLANFLRSSARVRALSLSHNYLGDAGLRLICDGLKENKSVTALDLPDNNITDVGAAILAEAIKDNPSLTQLQLAYNKIGDQGAIALAQVIRTSQSLKKLGLSYNKIGKAGCQALTAAITQNQSLKQLQLLPENPVEEKDAKALAKALKRNNKFSIKQLLGMKAD